MSADQEMVKGLLDEARIPCMIRNEQLAMALGELAPSDCSPEVWILNDEDYPRAREIVEALRNSRKKRLTRGLVPVVVKRLKANSRRVGTAGKKGRSITTTRSVIQNQPTQSGFCAWRAAKLQDRSEVYISLSA